MPSSYSDFYFPTHSAANDPGKSKKCLFSSIGTSCTEKVHGLICNQHASTLFGLTFQLVSTYNMNNGGDAFIETYGVKNNPIDIPLFVGNTNGLDDNGRAYLAIEIEKFCNRAVSRDQSIRKDDLLRVMSTVLGVSGLTSLGTQCERDLRLHSYQSWISNANSVVTGHGRPDPGEKELVFNLRDHLTPFHRSLLAHTMPQSRSGGDRHDLYNCNVGFVVDPNSPDYLTYKLCVLPHAKDTFLVMTDKDDCRASPLILEGSAIRQTSTQINSIVMPQQYGQHHIC